MIDQAAIKIKNGASAELAKATALFLASGGQIEKAEPFQYKPKPFVPYGYNNIAPAQLVRRRVRKEPPKTPPPVPAACPAPAKPTLTELQAFRQQRDTLIAEMAQTKSLDDVCAATGLARRTLAAIAKRRGFQFKPNYKGRLISEQKDAKNIERIKAMQRIGLTYRQCCARVGISLTTLRRLIKEAGIDYPKQRRK